MCRDIVAFLGLFARSRWSAEGLVVAVWVEGELAEEFAGGGVDDSDVQVLDQEQDVGSGVGSSDAVCRICPATRRVTQPVLSILSVRTRSWVSVSRLLAGSALGSE